MAKVTDNKDLPIYEETVIEFVTVAAEYCASLEQCGKQNMLDFLNRMTKIIPLLYLKASLLPDLFGGLNEASLNAYVTEMDYEQIRNRIAHKMGEYDSYLETQTEDMKYSDTAVAATISEQLADIYQDIKDMIENFKTANKAVMDEALINCKDNFKDVWGQKAINALGAMHNVLYSPDTDFGASTEEEDKDSFDENGEI